MPNLLENLLEFLPPLLLPLSNDLFCFDALPWNVHPIPNDSNSSVVHLENLGNKPFLKHPIFPDIVFKATRTIPDESLIVTVNEQKHPSRSAKPRKLAFETLFWLNQLQTAFAPFQSSKQTPPDGARQRFALWYSHSLP